VQPVEVPTPSQRIRLLKLLVYLVLVQWKPQRNLATCGRREHVRIAT
jgi:hypothetical protein